MGIENHENSELADLEMETKPAKVEKVAVAKFEHLYLC